MNTVYAVLALIIGLVVPLQAAVNTQLKGHLEGSTLLTTLVSFACGTGVLVLITLLSGQRLSALGRVSDASWWQLTGGLMGALFVFATTLVAPRIGFAAMVALITAGQVLTGLGMDHFGTLGMPVRELSSPRVIGGLLVVMGVVLVNFGDRFFSQP